MRSALFIVTALATGYQTLIHAIIFVCGRSGYAFRPTQLLTLAGAALLFASALVPWRVRWFRSVALLGCALPWIYLGPGIVLYLQAVASGQDYFDILILLPSLFLLASSIYVLRSLRAQPPSQPSTTTTPPPACPPFPNYDSDGF